MHRKQPVQRTKSDSYMLTTVRVNNQIAHRKQLVAGISALPLSLTFLLATAYKLNSGIATSMHDDLPQSFLMLRQCTRRIKTFHTSIAACSLLRLTPLYGEVAAKLTIAAALAICIRSLTIRTVLILKARPLLWK